MLVLSCLCFRNQILFIESSDLITSFNETINEILSFIDVPQENLKIMFLNKSRVNEKEKYRSDIMYLRDFYKPYNEKLYRLLGKEFNWNSPSP